MFLRPRTKVTLSPTSNVGFDFPDFPACVTAGKTLEEARNMAAEALTLHIAGKLQDGDPIPAPSALDIVMSDPANRDAVAFLVDARTQPVKSVRVNVLLPQDLVAAIDRVAANRSRFLADATHHALSATLPSPDRQTRRLQRSSRRSMQTWNARSPRSHG